MGTKEEDVEVAYVSFILGYSNDLGNLLGNDVGRRWAEKVRVGGKQGRETVQVYKVNVAGHAFFELVGIAESAISVLGKSQW